MKKILLIIFLASILIIPNSKFDKSNSSEKFLEDIYRGKCKPPKVPVFELIRCNDIEKLKEGTNYFCEIEIIHSDYRSCPGWIHMSVNLNVIDGDTIKLNNRSIRFSGIDAPEMKQKCKKEDEIIYCGKLSRDILIKKIGDKKVPSCKIEGKDIYNRTLAECFINGESLSRFLVRSGYAFAFRKYSKKYVEDEEYAKANKLGIWTMEFKYPWEYRRNK